jgi:TolA-binding protein
MYSLGSAQYEIGKPDLAMETLQSLLARYPNSDFMNKTLLKSGLIAFNENQAEKALNYYKQVLTHNPTPEEASAAITSIKEIYVELGRPDDYLAFVETVPGFKPSNMERDSLTFNAAQKSFNQRNYPQAITNLDKYIQAFPNGLHFLEARWMRAESYFSQRDYAKALIDYDFVIRKGSSAYTEISLRKASDIAYQINKDYPLAHTYFNSLVKEATTDEVRFEAYLGALRTAYKTRKYDVVSSYGELILQNPRATESEKAETQYYMAKAALEQGQLSNAKKAFQEVVRLSSDDVRGAEARYQIAYIIFKERNIDAAQKLCFENNKALGSEPYWLVKNYILIADTYTEQKNLFQAKATLQSIVDNYDGDQGLLNEAKSKLEQVKRMEAGKTKLDDSDKNKKIMEMDDEN